MLAAFVSQLGAAELIEVGDVPEPVLGPGELLVDVRLTAVNPVDTLVRSGVFRTALRFPFVLGRDCLGTVREIGPGAAGFQIGDLVWCNSLGHEGRTGAASEQVVVPADRLYHLPPGVDPVVAVSVVHPAATAYLALFSQGELRAGETVCIVGAAGNVGSAAVILAHASGARVIAIANPDDADYCRSLGAEVVLDYRAEQRDRLTELGGVDVWVDTFGANDLRTAVAACNRRGRIIVLAGPESTAVLPTGSLYLKNCSVRGFIISYATTGELATAAGRINELLADGRLRPRAITLVSVHRMAAVHRSLERGELSGRRAVLHFDPENAPGKPIVAPTKEQNICHLHGI